MKKILYIDMDNCLVDFRSAFAHIDDDLLREYEGHEDDVPGIFARMHPMPGAIAAFGKLADLYDTYVLSTSPWANPSAWSDKLVWVKRHLGEAAHKRLILTHHKDLCRGHYLVDDRLTRGAAEFEGTLIRFGSEEYPDWPAVVRFLEEEAAVVEGPAAQQVDESESASISGVSP
jgi:5'-nucleotidase